MLFTSCKYSTNKSDLIEYQEWNNKVLSTINEHCNIELKDYSKDKNSPNGVMVDGKIITSEKEFIMHKLRIRKNLLNLLNDSTIISLNKKYLIFEIYSTQETNYSIVNSDGEKCIIKFTSDKNRVNLDTIMYQSKEDFNSYLSNIENTCNYSVQQFIKNIWITSLFIYKRDKIKIETIEIIIN